MDIFVDVLLNHYKELTWMSISADLGCPPKESKKLLIDTVAAALEREDLPEGASIQCIFNGPSPDDSASLCRHLVQTQARKDDWPPNNYLTSVYGENAVTNSDLCLQTVWLSRPNLEMDKALVATDDLFHDLYSKAQRSALQDILYVAPFAQSVLSKLGLRSNGTSGGGGGGCCGPSKNVSASAEMHPSGAVPKTADLKIEQNPLRGKVDAPTESQPATASLTPSKPAAKRRKNNPPRKSKAETSVKPEAGVATKAEASAKNHFRKISDANAVSPVVALGATASPEMPESAMAESAMAESAVLRSAHVESALVEGAVVGSAFADSVVGSANVAAPAPTPNHPDEMEETQQQVEAPAPQRTNLFEMDEEMEDDEDGPPQQFGSAKSAENKQPPSQNFVPTQTSGQSKKTTTIEKSAKGGLTFTKSTTTTSSSNNAPPSNPSLNPVRKKSGGGGGGGGGSGGSGGGSGGGGGGTLDAFFRKS